MPSPLPVNERERLQAVHSYAVLDTPPEAEYDAITQLASQICGTPVSLITLLDEDRQWFKSAQGTAIKETPREYAFCNYAILEPGRPLVVPDLRRDERFRSNPLVTEDPQVVFYAGVPLTDSDGFALGSLCVIDTQANNLTPFQLNALQVLAGQVTALLGLHRKIKILQTVQRLLEERNDELQKALNHLSATGSLLDELRETAAMLKRSTSLNADESTSVQKAEQRLLQLTAVINRIRETT